MQIQVIVQTEYLQLGNFMELPKVSDGTFGIL